MFSILGDSVGKIVKCEPRASVDNVVSRLHYRWTSLFLFLCCTLVSAYQFIGNPINCVNNSDIPEDVINTYCWITSTFTVPQALKGVSAHPGVAPMYAKGGTAHESKRHTYYQWVPFFLFLQGMLFHVPHYIWKTYGANKFTSLMHGLYRLEGEATIPIRRKASDRLDAIAEYFWKSLRSHGPWTYIFIGCELFNLLNVIGNIMLTNHFLGNEWGSEVLQFVVFGVGNWSDPLDKVFPKVTKCTFNNYGPSGTVQIHDSLCVLALNIINEKIFLLVWFWFHILAVITFLWLILHLTLISCSGLWVYHLSALLKLQINKAYLKNLVGLCSMSDWFLLTSLVDGMTPRVRCEFIKSLADALERPSDYSQPDKYFDYDYEPYKDFEDEPPTPNPKPPPKRDVESVEMTDPLMSQPPSIGQSYGQGEASLAAIEDELAGIREELMTLHNDMQELLGKKETT